LLLLQQQLRRTISATPRLISPFNGTVVHVAAMLMLLSQPLCGV
jgi:hypothetical protein